MANPLPRAQQADQAAQAALREAVACRLRLAWEAKQREVPSFTLTCWAGLSGVSLRTLQRVLDGKNTSLDTIEALARAVDLPADGLFRAA